LKKLYHEVEFTDKSLPQPTPRNAKRLRKTEFRLGDLAVKTPVLASETAMAELDADADADDEMPQVSGKSDEW